MKENRAILFLIKFGDGNSLAAFSVFSQPVEPNQRVICQPVVNSVSKSPAAFTVDYFNSDNSCHKGIIYKLFEYRQCLIQRHTPYVAFGVYSWCAV